MATIRHFAIISPWKPEELAQFYSECFGLTRMSQESGRWLTDGYFQFTILGGRGPGARKGPGGADHGINHWGFCIEPEEKEGIVERMAKWGVALEPPPPNLPLVEEKVHDPEGNEFDVASRTLLPTDAIAQTAVGKHFPATVRHIAVVANDPEKLAQFYIECFGMKRMPESRGVWLTDGYLQFTILPAGRGRPNGVNHWGFTVDADAKTGIVEKMAKWNIPLEPPPPNLPLVEEKVHDPDGNEFDFATKVLAGVEGTQVETATS